MRRTRVTMKTEKGENTFLKSKAKYFWAECCVEGKQLVHLKKEGKFYCLRCGKETRE